MRIEFTPFICYANVCVIGDDGGGGAGRFRDKLSVVLLMLKKSDFVIYELN